MDQFFTWTMLATYAGAVAATTLFTQALKALIPIKTQLLSIIIAFVVLVAASAFTTGLSVENILLGAVNAVVVAFASNGAFEVVSGGKKE